MKGYNQKKILNYIVQHDRFKIIMAFSQQIFFFFSYYGMGWHSLLEMQVWGLIFYINKKIKKIFALQNIMDIIV